MYTWTFEQITGTNRRRLDLVGYAAPFGRPRKDPVLTEKQKLRIQSVYYPGSSSAPTRNVFGANWEEFELKGRWMTRSLATKTANDLADTWTTFFRDGEVVRLSWGPIVSYTGVMSELELARESEDEIAWKMVFLIDEREGFEKQQSATAASEPPVEDSIGALQLFLAKATPGAELSGKISPDFFESLDNLASALNGPSALLNNLVGQFENFEKATFSAVAHFKSAVTGVHTALVRMRELVLNTAIDSILVVRSAQSELEWLKYQAEFDHDSCGALESMAFLSRKADLAGKSEASKTVLAVEGDSWESLATRTVGLARSGELRSFNGARYGEQPIPGTTYLVP